MFAFDPLRTHGAIRANAAPYLVTGDRSLLILVRPAYVRTGLICVLLYQTFVTGTLSSHMTEGLVMHDLPQHLVGRAAAAYRPTINAPME
jgi:hypothetical protein